MSEKISISLCMIVRNEATLIGQCLHSVKDFVDEMIVVDTGSADKTVEVARGFGATVHQYPWTGDFSQARNHSISHAKGGWILVLDADEMLAQRDARRLRQQVAHDVRAHGIKLIQRTYLQNANFVCASPNPGDYAEGQDYTDCLDVPVIRLFQNDSRIRYSGRVHELVEPAFVSHRFVYETSDLVIHHFGKVGDPAHLAQKKRLYLDLGRQKVLDEPKNALAQFELGVQLYELESYPECIASFDASLKLNPSYDLALLYIAKALHNTGRMVEAAQYFRTCLKRGPNNDKVLFDYANFTRDRGDFKAALGIYQKAVRANPRHSLALFNMGVLHFRTGDPHQGMSLIERAIRLNPDNATFHENLGCLPLAGPALLTAAGLIESYIQKFPQAGVCLAALAEIYFKARLYDKAIETAGRARAVGPERLGVLLVQANARFSLGRLQEAEVTYRFALALAPGNLDSMMNLAAIAEARGDRASARSLYLSILDAHPGQLLALRRLAAAQARDGFDEEAINALDRACTADLSDPQCLLLVGSLFENSGKLERAAELYRSAARHKPEWRESINQRVLQLSRPVLS